MRVILALAVTALAGTAAAPGLADPPRDAVASRFAGDAEAARLAVDLFDSDGDVVDVLPPERFDGGYRGVIQLEPALPVGADRKHLAWVHTALRDFDDFFAAIGKRAAPRYRWRG